MTDELILYTNPRSRGRIARWMLEEVGEPYRAEILQYGPAMKAPEYLAINPMGKVPALKHGDVVVTEGAAICAYLADAFPQAGLMPPAGSPARGAFYRWMFFGAGPLEQAIVNKSFDFVLPEAGGGRRAGYGSLELVLDTLDAHLAEHEFFVGDRFSAADVYVGTQIIWGLMLGTIDKRPNFMAYAERLRLRPALVKAAAEDDRLIAAMAEA